MRALVDLVAAVVLGPAFVVVCAGALWRMNRSGR